MSLITSLSSPMTCQYTDIYSLKNININTYYSFMLILILILILILLSQFVVGSGKQVIGSVKISAKEFSVARADQRGVKRITMTLVTKKYFGTESHDHFSGKLKVTYKVGIVRENQYITRPRQIERLHEEEVGLPYNAVIKKIVATGMPSVHAIGPNEPRFRCTYDGLGLG